MRLSSKSNPSATFIVIATNLRVVTADGYEFKYGNNAWQDILSSTAINSSGNRTILVRIKVTRTDLASAPTANLD